MTAENFAIVIIVLPIFVAVLASVFVLWVPRRYIWVVSLVGALGFFATFMIITNRIGASLCAGAFFAGTIGFSALINRRWRKNVPNRLNRLMAMRVSPLKRGAIINSNITQDEVVMEGPASFAHSLLNLGGWIFLTKDHLYFKSNELQPIQKEVELKLAEVSSIKAYRVMGFIPKGLRVMMNSGRATRFNVNNPWEWKKRIEALRLRD